MDINELSLDEIYDIANLELRWWSSGCGRVELCIRLEDARTGHHPGACDADIAALLTVPYIRKQLDKIEPELLAKIVGEYSDYSEEELADHESNLSRILWFACGDVSEENAQ